MFLPTAARGRQWLVQRCSPVPYPPPRRRWRRLVQHFHAVQLTLASCVVWSLTVLYQATRYGAAGSPICVAGVLHGDTRRWQRVVQHIHAVQLTLAACVVRTLTVIYQATRYGGAGSPICVAGDLHGATRRWQRVVQHIHAVQLTLVSCVVRSLTVYYQATRYGGAGSPICGPCVGDRGLMSRVPETQPDQLLPVTWLDRSPEVLLGPLRGGADMTLCRSPLCL